MTENLRAVRSLPLRIENAPERLIVRGEVYMAKSVFAELNAEREIRGETLLEKGVSLADSIYKTVEENL